MSRERDAIEEIWEILRLHREVMLSSHEACERVEQILTMTEDLIQEDLEQMESSTRSREIPKVCPLLEEYKKSQGATDTQKFWDEIYPV